jgi:hypothetical protein
MASCQRKDLCPEILQAVSGRVLSSASSVMHLLFAWVGLTHRHFSVLENAPLFGARALDGSRYQTGADYGTLASFEPV